MTPVRGVVKVLELGSALNTAELAELEVFYGWGKSWSTLCRLESLARFTAAAHLRNVRHVAVLETPKCTQSTNLDRATGFAEGLRYVRAERVAPAFGAVRVVGLGHTRWPLRFLRVVDESSPQEFV